MKNPTRTSSNSTHKTPVHSQRLVLESRLVFDGAMAVTVAEVQPDSIDNKPVSENSSVEATLPSEPAINFSPEKPQAVVDYQPAADTTDQQPAFAPAQNSLDSTDFAVSPVAGVSGSYASTLIVVDPRADNAADLLANPPASTQVFTLDTTRDGFQQVADLLQGRHDVTELHVLPWTEGNTQWLGNKPLTNTLDPSVSNALTQWGDGFTDNANIVFHGTSNLGTSWLNHIDALTGADTHWSQDTHFTDLTPTLDNAIAHPATSVVFIDSAVRDSASIVKAIDTSADIVYLNNQSSGISQIADYLSGSSGISNIQIISHSTEASLILGNESLSSNDLTAYTAQLAAIGQSLTDTGDILLYGCDLAKSDDGAAFINHFAALTSADVAASTNTTGATTKGGDWVLEYNVGIIDTKTIVALDFQDFLAAPMISSIIVANGTYGTGSIVPIAVNFSIPIGVDWTSGKPTLTINVGGISRVVNYVSGNGIFTGGNLTGLTFNYTIRPDDIDTNGISVDANSFTLNGGIITDAASSTNLNPANSAVTDNPLATVAAPTDSSVASIVITSAPLVGNANGGTAYAAGDVVQTTVTFKTPETVTGTPSLELDIGGNIRTAKYVSSPTTTTALFEYTIVAGDADTNGIAVVGNSLATDGGSINGSSGIAAIITHAAVADDPADKVNTVADTTAPIFRSAVGSGSTITLTYDELGSGLLNNTTVATASQFTFSRTINGGSSTGLLSVSSVSINHAAQTVSLQLNGLINRSDTNMAVNYTPNGTNNIQDVAGKNPVGFTNVYVANTMPTFNVNGNSMAFNDPIAKIGNGTAVGDQVLYRNIISVDGQSIDAVVTTTAITAGTSITDADGLSFNPADPLVGTPAQLDANWYKLNTTIGAGGGTATITFDFIKSNTYGTSSTTSTGEDVILQNVPINSYDIDATAGSGSPQLQEFGGFASYTVSSSSQLIETQLAGFTRFQVTSTPAVPSVTDGAGTVLGDSVRVMALYNTIHSFQIKTGATGSGEAWYYLDFSKGPNWAASAPTYQIPTVNPRITDDTTPDLTGTFIGTVGNSTDQAYKLSITVNGVVGTYTAGDVAAERTTLANGDIQLLDTVSGLKGIFNPTTGFGTWSITIPTTLALTTYDVQATVDYGASLATINRFTTDTTTNELTIIGSGTADNTAPTLISFERLNPTGANITPANLATQNYVDFKATFSEAVTNVDTTDFLLKTGSVSGAVISSVTQSGTNTYTIRVSNIPTNTSSGTLNLDLAATNNVVDLAGNILGILPANLIPSSALGKLDNDLLTDQTYNISINRPPVAVDDLYSMNSNGTAITLTPLALDSDPDGNPLSLVSINGTALSGGIQTIPVTNGTVTVSAANVISFTPTANFSGTVTFAYVLSDGTSTTSANEIITVSNRPPVAVDDLYSMNSNGTAITLTPLALDSDPDGNPLSLVSINGTALSGGIQTIPVTNGTVTVSAANVISFTPTANFSGTVTFAYVLSDGTSTTSANEIITVSNRPPVAVDDLYSMNSNGTAITLTPLALDSDPDGNPLSLVSINGTALSGGIQTIPVTNGTVTVSAANVISFTPTANFSGTVTFAYLISDGTSTTSANEIITVSNRPPVAVDDLYSMNSNGTAITLTPLALDSDPDGNPLSLVSINGTALSGGIQTIPVTNGTVTVSAANVISFTPTANFSGTVTFAYVLSDGTSTTSANEIITVSNRPPVAVDDLYSMNSNGTAITLTPLALDSDPDGNPLSLVSINGTALSGGIQTIPVTNGTVTVSAANVISFTPTANFSGTVTFAYVLSDGTSTTSANEIITVSNRPPVAVDDLYSMNSNGTAITLTPLALDSDPDGNPLSLVSINGTALSGGIQTIPVTNGTVTVSAANVISFTPTANFSGTVTFAYVLSDGTSTTSANEIITVSNRPPVAVDDLYSMNSNGTAITLTPLALDSDPDGNPLSLVSINGTALSGGIQTIPVTNGTVTVSAANVISFTPTANFSGTVTFAYVLSDGTSTTSANEIITVSNRPPVAVDDLYSMNSNGTAITLTPLALDSDPDGNPLSLVSINGTALSGGIQTIPVTNGTVTVSAANVISFTPTANFSGTVTFAYVLSDGTSTTSANEIITVSNRPPVAVDDLYSMNSNGTAITLTPLALDSDPDGNPLSLVSINGTALSGGIQTIPVTNGTVTVSAANVISFTPTANFSGTVTFAYVLSDGTSTTSANEIITVSNRPPVAVDDLYSMNSNGTAITLTPLALDSDPDGNPLSLVSINGTALSGGIQTIPVTNGTVTVSAANVISFTPTANFSGTVTFAYVLSDGTSTTSANEIITVSNRPPVAVDDLYSMNSNGTAITLTPLALDSDPDGNPLSLVSINGTALSGGIQTIPVTNGTVTVSAANVISFTPTANFSGTVTFAYVLSDGTSTTSANEIITVSNRPPVAVDDLYSMNSNGTAITLTPLALDSDPDGNPLSLVSINGTALSGGIQTIPVTNGTVTVSAANVISFTPTANFSGTVTFAYVLSDGTSTTSANEIITVSNRPPVAVDDLYSMNSNGTAITLTPLALDSDPDGNPLSLVSINGTALSGGIQTIPVTNGTVTVSAANVISFTPTANFSGTVTFAYVLSDGTSTTSANEIITVSNRPPVAVDDLYSMNSNGTAITLTPLALDSDPDGNPLSLVSINGTALSGGIQTIPVTNGTVTVSAANVISFTPTANFSGTVTFAYVLSDGTSTTSANEIITVSNRPPVAVDDLYSMNSNGTAITLTPLALDSDPDGNPLSLVSINGTALSGGIQTIPVTNGTVTVSAANVISFTPTANFSGTVTFAYVLSDGTSTTSANEIITVSNRPPVAVDDLYSMNSNGTAITLTPLALDSDPDGNPLSLVSINGTALSGGIQTIPVTNGTVTVSAANVISFTPTANFSGTVTFAYVLSDGTSTTSANEIITVSNRPPVAVDDLYSMNSNGTALTLTPLALDSDPDGNPLSLVSINGTALSGGIQTIPVTNGTVTVSAANVISFTPTANFSGTVTFAYVLSDGTSTTSANEIITVSNRPPVAVDDLYSMNSNGTAITLTPLALDSDPDGNPLSLVSINGTALSGGVQTIPVTNGTVTVSAANVISFTPTANFSGTVTFAYVLSDGTSTTSANEIITVSNRPPVATNDSTTAVTGQPVTINVLGNDTDPENDINPATVKIVGTANAGDSLVVAGQGTWTVNPTTGAITFTPLAGFTADPTPISYTVRDKTGLPSNPATVTVDYPQTPPVATNDSTTAVTGQPVTINVLGNDTDPENDINPATVKIVGTANAGDSLVVAGQGTWTVNPTTGAITFTPLAGFTADPTPISYTVRDKTGLPSNPATVTVDYPQTPPVATNDSTTAVTGQPVTINVLGNDTDPENDINPATVKIVGTANAGDSLVVAGQGTWTVNPTTGAITFTPLAGFTADPTPISYTVRDKTGLPSNPATVTVDYPQTPPVATNDSTTAVTGQPVTINVLGNDTDPENDINPATVKIVGTANAGDSLVVAGQGTWTVNPTTGAITFTPLAGFTADPTPISYTVRDRAGLTSNPASITVDYPQTAFIINPVNITKDIGASGSLILLSNPDRAEVLSTQNNDKDKKGYFDYKSEDNNSLPPAHLSLYVPIRNYILSLTGSVRDQVVLELEPYSFTVPSWAFRHTDAGEQLEFKSTRANGTGLPQWLKFDPKTLIFSGIPPKGAQNERVMVTARDTHGNEVHAIFKVHVNKECVSSKPCDVLNKVLKKPRFGEKPVVGGKAGLAEQVHAAGKLNKLQESRALLDSLKQL